MASAFICAYYMKDGMTYVGIYVKANPKEDEVTIRDFIIMPTIKITQDKRAPEVVISEEYNNRNKGLSTILSLENKIGSSNISLALKPEKKINSPR